MDQSRHLDPERLAAFMDGSLPRAERQAVEAHAADCAHCLKLLAAMARTEPSPARTQWRPFVVLRWAVPLAAAATALALWVNVSQDRHAVDRHAVAPPQAAQPVPPATVAEAPVPVSKPDTLESRIQQPRTAAEDAQSTARGLKRPGPEAAAKNLPRPQSPPPIERQRSGARQEDEALRLKTAEEKREVSPRRDAPPATSAPAPAAAAPTPVAEPFADRRNETAARSLARQSLTTTVEVVSFDPMHRWRAVGTVVQRTTDGGKAWTTQAVPLPAEVLAGSSPSPNVCWLVGRAGTVLLTADGTNWQRLSFPAAVDVTAVRASNAREAEVTTVDGRVFRTADGGRNWAMR